MLFYWQQNWRSGVHSPRCIARDCGMGGHIQNDKQKRMNIPIYQVDAFASHVFSGNPAAVCPLANWLDDETLLNIAEENNLSETAFFVANGQEYQLRWFTPAAEVDLCGHATLAAAHVLFKHLDYALPTITFSTRSGNLLVNRNGSGYSIDFPASMPQVTAAPEALLEGLGVSAKKVMKAYDYIVVVENETTLAALQPDVTRWVELDLRGVVVTAPGDEVDFVSRCFFPKLSVDEDPVTGSAHCELAPYWQHELTKNELVGKQLSARGGIVHCKLDQRRVILTGDAADYMQGSITL